MKNVKLYEYAELIISLKYIKRSHKDVSWVYDWSILQIGIIKPLLKEISTLMSYEYYIYIYI